MRVADDHIARTRSQLTYGVPVMQLDIEVPAEALSQAPANDVRCREQLAVGIDQVDRAQLSTSLQVLTLYDSHWCHLT